MGYKAFCRKYTRLPTVGVDVQWLLRNQIFHCFRLFTMGGKGLNSIGKGKKQEVYLTHTDRQDCCSSCQRPELTITSTVYVEIMAGILFRDIVKNWLCEIFTVLVFMNT